MGTLVFTASNAKPGDPARPWDTGQLIQGYQTHPDENGQDLPQEKTSFGSPVKIDPNPGCPVYRNIQKSPILRSKKKNRVFNGPKSPQVFTQKRILHR